MILSGRPLMTGQPLQVTFLSNAFSLRALCEFFHLKMTVAETFNVEEFLVFTGESATIDSPQELSQDTATSNWPAYPDLFPKEEAKKEDPISLISFDGASLYKEEYVDPFASLSPKYEAGSTEFLAKLKLRRKKLDNLARNLQTRKPLEQWAHLEDSLSCGILPWQREVQVYSLFSITSSCKSDRIYSSALETHLGAQMLDFFQMNLPEYLAG